MQIRTRLTVAFALLATIVLAVATLALAELSGEHRQFDAFVNGHTARADLAARIRSAVDERAIAARNLVLVTDPADLALERAAVERAHAAVRTHVDQLKARVSAEPDLPAEVHALVAEIDRIEQAYTPVALDIVARAVRGEHAAAVAKMNAECRPLLASLVQSTDRFAAMTAEAAQRQVAASGAGYAANRAILVAASLLALGITLVAGWLVTRAIVLPLGQAVQLAEAVAEGDLTRRLTPAGRDEVARLLSALGAMSEKLAGIVSQVRHNSESIASGAGEIAAGSNDLSQRTEEQASALEQTAASMEQLSVT